MWRDLINEINRNPKDQGVIKEIHLWHQLIIGRSENWDSKYQALHIVLVEA